ncbi:purine and uridine phosphorylase [Colletotrichum caudatum]|nr:purine and uridine phosphorylase [Colletotrichum caudatum]
MSDHSKYTIGWICAITIEYNAAQVILDETHDPPERTAENDNNTYTLGRIGKHNVVITILPQGQYGLSSAAAAARDLVRSFPNVRIGLMVGVGGGAPSSEADIRLGDVVVSSPRDERGGVYQYDFGKSLQDKAFRTTGFLNQPPAALLAAVNSFKAEIQRNGPRLDEAINHALVDEPRLRRLCARPPAETDRLFRSDVVFDSSRSDADIRPEMLVQRPDRHEHNDNPAVHYGLIASANQLMKDAVIRDKFAVEEGVLCFEMEAAGLMNHFPCLVIRGICDYSDSHKNKSWQGYAAMTAAAYAKELVCRVQQSRLESEQKLSLLRPGLRNVELQIATLEERTNVTKFDKLLVVEAAMYDAHHNQHEPTCHPGTRLGVIDGIRDWAEDPNDQDVYWLSGLAGTGKSTIARTLAQEFDKNHTLAGTFFFKRGDTDRNKASLLFSTIARQLVEHRPDISRFLEAEIRDSSNISSKNIREQFKRLLHQPHQKYYEDNFKKAYFAACGLVYDEKDSTDQPDKWSPEHTIALDACNKAIPEALVISHGRSKSFSSPSTSPVSAVHRLEGVDMENPAYVEVHEATHFQAANTARLEAENTKSLILIIDAIDECAMGKDVEIVVPLLSEIAKSKVYNLKVLATSRPELPIRYAFGTIEGKYQEVRLHEISGNNVACDIEKFLEHELEQIRRRWNWKNRSQISRQLNQDWPGYDRVKTLVKISSCLFIFASTACRFIGDSFSSPEKQISVIIDGFLSSAQSPVRDRLAPTYLPVLWQFKDDRNVSEQADLLRKFQDIVGTLVLLEEALSVNAIASLLDIEAIEVDQIIDPLSSAMDIPEDSDAPVKPFHLSFRDFLLGPSAGEFSIPFLKTHQKIAFSCLDLLSRRWPLSLNIFRQDPKGSFSIKETVSEQFPPYVAYACLHWIYHVEKAELWLKDGDEVHQFFQTHLLHWLEALMYLKASCKVSTKISLNGLIERVKLAQ